MQRLYLALTRGKGDVYFASYGMLPAGKKPELIRSSFEGYPAGYYSDTNFFDTFFWQRFER